MDERTRADKGRWLLTNLRLITELQPGQRINMDDGVMYVVSDSLLDRLVSAAYRRFVCPQDRWVTVQTVHALLMEVCDLLNTSDDDSEDARIYQNMASALVARVPRGLQALQQTYYQDKTLVAYLQTTMEMLKLRCPALFADSKDKALLE